MKKIGLVILFVFCSSINVFAFDEKEKNEIENIVREYLLENPQLFFEIQEKLEEYQQEQQAIRAAETKQVIQNRYKELFEYPYPAIMGNPDGEITIVEFFDYNCFYCQKVLANMDEIVRNNDDVKIVLKEFPIFGEDSINAGLISAAVNRLYPKQYAEFHARLMLIEGRKNKESAIGIAKEMKMDENKIIEESQKDEIMQEINNVHEIAQELKITGTPAFVIADEVVFGAQETEVFDNIIANMRECGNVKCT